MKNTSKEDYLKSALLNHFPQYQDIIRTSFWFNLLKLPEVKLQIVSQNSQELLDSLEISSPTPSPYSSSGGVSNNVESLKSLPTFSRGDILADTFLASHADLLGINNRVLVIGSRNISELLSLYSYGVNPDLVDSIDLIENHPFTKRGDISVRESLPINKYTAIFMGWVLPYLKFPSAAIDNILALGQDEFYFIGGHDEQECSIGGGSANFTANEIIKHIQSQFDIEIVLHRKSSPPYTASRKREIYILKISKPGCTKLICQREEEKAVERAYRGLTTQLGGHPEIEMRSAAHAIFLKDLEYTNASQEGYLIMRRHYFQHGPMINNYISDRIAEHHEDVLPTQIAISNLIGSNTCFESSDKIENVLLSLKQNGYYLFNSQVPTSMVEELVEFTSIVGCRPTNKMWEGRRDIVYNDRCHETILRLAFDPFILAVVASYLKVIPILDSFTIARTYPRNFATNEDLSADAQLFHSDADRLAWLKVFIYLTDVNNDDDGAHEYIPGTHVIRTFEGRKLLEEVSGEYGKPLKITGGKGTIFIGDTRCIHRGGVVNRQHRDLLQLQYSNSLFGEETPKIPREKGILFPFRRLIRSYPRLAMNFIT